MAVTHSHTSQRTLLVLFGPEQQTHSDSVKQRITSAGFRIVAEANVVSEELEEAGIDVDSVRERGQDVAHVAYVLERDNAVGALKDLMGEGRAALDKNSLSAIFRELRMFGAPSQAASEMSIAIIFPHLTSSDLSPPNPTTTIDAPPSSISRVNHPTFPFALSNLAHSSPPARSPDILSPSMARALQTLEKREEEEVKRKSGEITESVEKVARAGGDGDERRVFTYHSRDTSMTFGDDASQFGERTAESATGSELDSESYGDEEYAEDEEIEALEAEQDVLDALDEDELVALAGATVVEDVVILPPTASIRVASLAKPAIQPRLTKAAKLRLGISIPPRTPQTTGAKTDDSTPTTSTSTISKSDSTPRVKSLAAPSIAVRGNKTSMRRTGSEDSGTTPVTAVKIRREAVGTAGRSADPFYQDVPGYKRRHSIQVASTAKPAFEPRMTKSAMLRAGIEVPVRVKQTSTDDAEGSPSLGLEKKKRESISVKSTAPPAIAPRGTKASNLRAGVEISSTQRTKSTSVSENVVEGGQETALNASSAVAQRRSSIQVPPKRPAIEVRLTKTAALRTGVKQDSESPAVRRQRSTTSASSDSASATNGFDGIPGHKRRESIQVASTARPKVEPKMSKAAMLRAGMKLPETAKERRASMGVVATATSFEGVPGHRRRESLATVPSSRPPTITPRPTRSSVLRQGPVDTVSIALLTAPLRPRPTPSRSSSISSSVVSKPVQAPSLAPRTNRSAELRAAKKTKEAEDLALLEKKKGSKGVTKRPSTSQGILRAVNGGVVV